MKEPDKTTDSMDRLSALIVCRNMEIEELVEQNRNYVELVKMLTGFNFAEKSALNDSVNIIRREHVSNNSYDKEAAINALKDIHERFLVEGAL